MLSLDLRVLIFFFTISRNFSFLEKAMEKKKEEIDDSSMGMISNGHLPEGFSTSTSY